MTLEFAWKQQQRIYFGKPHKYLMKLLQYTLYFLLPISILVVGLFMVFRTHRVVYFQLWWVHRRENFMSKMAAPLLSSKWNLYNIRICGIVAIIIGIGGLFILISNLLDL